MKIAQQKSYSYYKKTTLFPNSAKFKQVLQHTRQGDIFWGGRCIFLFDSTCFVAQSMSLLDTYFFRLFNIFNILITITRRFTYRLYSRAKFTAAPQKMSPWRVCCKNYWNFAEFGKSQKGIVFFIM
jgi:hypothetical protein